MLKNSLAIFGGIVILVLVLIAIFAPAIARYDPAAIDIKNALMGPSGEHILGTDQLGRDVFSRIVYGSRISLSIGLVAVGIAAIIGVALGSLAGYFGGRTDSLIMRFVDIMLCFPSFFLILSVIAIVGPNIYNIMVIIGLTSWMGMARLIRAEILSLKEREFILAARALGVSHFKIILRHLIPNGIGPVLVSFVLGVAAAILIETGLSFLGLGVQPPTPTWGNILMEGRATLGVAWWLILFPGFIILVTVLGFNLLGEGLKDALNPKLRRQAGTNNL
ncbi:MAG: ABC transporter permease [Candidatus Omnitrophota bacterium]|nr:ABC transporter permease [Candidatus Omnitrophota bacterium]